MSFTYCCCYNYCFVVIVFAWSLYNGIKGIRWLNIVSWFVFVSCFYCFPWSVLHVFQLFMLLQLLGFFECLFLDFAGFSYGR